MRHLRAYLIAAVAAILLVLGFNSGAVHAASMPAQPDSDFYDGINLLDDSTKSLVESKNRYYQSTSQKPQVVLAAIKSTGGDDIDSYAPDLFSKWGIGQKGKDNGILILYALNGGKRNVRIEVGYGAEGYLTDAISGRILNDNLSGLKSSDKAKTNAALRKVFKAVSTMVDKHYKFKDAPSQVSAGDYNQYRGRSTRGSSGMSLLFKIIGIGVFVVIVVAVLLGNHGGSGRGGNGGGGGFWTWLLLGNLLGGGGRSRYYGDDPTGWGDDDDDDDPFGGFGGFGGGGSFGGGGGGFGGGSSGGGGASV